MGENKVSKPEWWPSKNVAFSALLELDLRRLVLAALRALRELKPR